VTCNAFQIEVKFQQQNFVVDKLGQASTLTGLQWAGPGVVEVNGPGQARPYYQQARPGRSF